MLNTNLNFNADAYLSPRGFTIILNLAMQGGPHSWVFGHVDHTLMKSKSSKDAYGDLQQFRYSGINWFSPQPHPSQ